MSKLKLKAKLTGVGSINNGYIYLENVPSTHPDAVEIGLYPKNSERKEWTNNNILIDVIGDLEYELYVHAYRGTSWTFKLLETKGTKEVEILSLSESTGGDPAQGHNVSVVKGTVNLNNLKR